MGTSSMENRIPAISWALMVGRVEQEVRTATKMPRSLQAFMLLAMGEHCA